MEYIHIFRNETDLINSGTGNIVSGAGESGEIKSGVGFGKAFQESASKQFGKNIKSQSIGIVNQYTFGQAGNIYKLGKTAFVSGIKSSAFAGALAGGLVSLAITGALAGIEAIVNAHQERIRKLEEKAQAENLVDSALIRAGTIDIYNKNITFDKYGKMKINRG